MPSNPTHIADLLLSHFPPHGLVAIAQPHLKPKERARKAAICPRVTKPSGQ